MSRWLISALLSCCGFAVAIADDYVADAFPLRNHNPFLQIYGLPTFQTADLAAPGGIDVNFSIDIANDMDEADRLGETLIIDAETRSLSLSLRRRVGKRFELGLDVPYIRHSGGFLDNVIYEFHDLVGLSNSTREGPSDQFRLQFGQEGTTLFDLSEPVSGIGDVQLSGAARFGKLTLRGGVKLPTGDADKMTGSGAADVSLGVYADGKRQLFGRALAYSGFIGILALGDGEVLADLQRSTVPYAGGALRWQATKNFSLVTQLYAQGSYFDVRLDELGGTTAQLAFGGDYRFGSAGYLLRFAIAEDIAADAAPDFAAHLSIRRYTR